MEEPVVRRPRINHRTDSKLPNVSHPLKDARVHDGSDDLRQMDEPVYWIVRREGISHRFWHCDTSHPIALYFCECPFDSLPRNGVHLFLGEGLGLRPRAFRWKHRV